VTHRLRFFQRHHLNTLIYLGVSVIGKAASLLLIPLYTSRLSRSDYGDYGLCQTLFWIVPTVLTLSLSAALGRFFFDDVDPVQRAHKVGGIASVIVALAVGGGLVGELFVDIVRPHAGALGPAHLRMVVWICALTAVNEIPAVYLRMSERAFAYALFNLSSFAITLGTTAYLMISRNLGLLGLLGGMATAQIVTGLFSFGFVRSLRPQPTRSLIRQALHYSVPFIPHVVGTSLMVGVDRWALDLFHLHDDLGLYTLAMQLTVPISLAVNAWNEASSPRFLAVWRDGGYPAARRALPRITAGFILCGVGALLFILFALPLLRFFVADRFRAAFVLVPWIGLSLVVGALFSAFINVLFLRKNTRLIPILTLSSVVVNVLLNLLFVPRLGVWGAVLATGLAFAFRSALMLRFALRELRRDEPAAA
jgi:O-antigen/teichoic acid export membrane protein